MSSDDTDDDPEAPNPGYKVGYRHPPLANRFKPGNPGNPRGRRKRVKTVGEIIQAALTKRVQIKENGRSRWVTMQELIIITLVRDAAKGDRGATRTVLGLQDRYQDSAETAINTADLEAEDRKLIAEHLARLSETGSQNAADVGKSEQENQS